MVDPPRGRRNTLGYAVNDAARRYETGAQIVWAVNSEGDDVWIDDVPSGRSDLRCACGERLIAKKGTERAHHFAHEAGTSEACRVARQAALARFIIATLSDGAHFRLPDTNHSTTKPLLTAASYDVFFDTVRVTATFKGRAVAIAATLTKKETKRLRELQLSPATVSLILVDLSAHKARADHEIAVALTDRAERYWLYNRSSKDHERAMQENRRREQSAVFPPLREGRASAGLAHPLSDASDGFDHAAATPKRLQDARRLMMSQDPNIDIDAWDSQPQAWLGGLTPYEYNRSRSDLVQLVERHLGLRDEFGRPTKR